MDKHPTDKQAAITTALHLVQQGMSANQAAAQTAKPLNVTPRTIQRWAQEAGTPLGDAAHDAAKNAREVAQAEYRARRARLRVDMLRVAESVLARIEGEEEGRAVQALAVSLGILVDKIRLEEGEPTVRTETWSADEWTRQLRLLEAQVAAGRTASTGAAGN